ncbi:hypothetical protein AB1Y20_005158 [Prymnesium parvum]|uniref:EF-hand domain-containing protein n=1 Tax=Prymnesium parvum TaxID=97485 RepID=A0AB34J5Q5_PRYPA
MRTLEGSAEILRRFDENHDGRMDFLEFNRLVDSLQAVSKRHGRYDAHIPEREVQPQSLATPVQYAECCPSCTNADGSYPWREEWHSAGRLHDDGKHAHVAWGYGAAHSRHDGEQTWGSVKDEYEDAERRRQLRLRLMEEALHIRTSQARARPQKNTCFTPMRSTD